jgi:dGTPase
VSSIYNKLLSNSRFRPSEVSDRHILLEAESDRGRLLFCPAFRRLQQKAQVFSMESNASVRHRSVDTLQIKSRLN